MREGQIYDVARGKRAEEGTYLRNELHQLGNILREHLINACNEFGLERREGLEVMSGQEVSHLFNRREVSDGNMVCT